MKNSDVYLRAAKIVAKPYEGDKARHAFCCTAIQKVTKNWDMSKFELFKDLFAPRAWIHWGTIWFSTDDECEIARNERILALLFMHEIAKSEERRKL